MKEAFDKIRQRLKEEVCYQQKCHDGVKGVNRTTITQARLKMKECYEHAIEIVNEVERECKDKYVSIGAYQQVAWERDIAIEQLHELGYEFGQKIDSNDGWIPCSERLPECDNKYGWVSCIVSVIRSHYPTSSYDICDSPYDENIVMHADYHVSQKIWHLDCDEQLNALMDIEDSPLNGDYVIAWQPLPTPFKPKGE